MYHDGSLKKKFPGEGKRDGSVVAIKIHETNQINNGNNITPVSPNYKPFSNLK